MTEWERIEVGEGEPKKEGLRILMRFILTPQPPEDWTRMFGTHRGDWPETLLEPEISGSTLKLEVFTEGQAAQADEAVPRRVAETNDAYEHVLAERQKDEEMAEREEAKRDALFERIKNRRKGQ